MAGMFSRGWCALVVLLMVLVPAGWVRGATPAAVRPNILFLFADDQRADTIGAWGNAHIRTPHLDGLVGRGLVFGATTASVAIAVRCAFRVGRCS